MRARIRHIQEQTGLTYQQVLNDLTRLRLPENGDEDYIAAHRARHTSNETCENCGEKFPVGYDKKGLQESDGGPFCPTCIYEYGVSSCLRCGEDKVLGEDADSFCSDCQSYIDNSDD